MSMASRASLKWLVLVVVVACAAPAKKEPAWPAESRPGAKPVESEPHVTGAAMSTDQCKRSDPFGPFELTGEEMLQRRGLGDRVFSDTASSPAAPIQVCGVRGELRWLTNVTCADGSRPWGRDLGKAHGARKGSASGQRRCGASVAEILVDRYEVPCPEKHYEVYIDMYECGPGEPFE
jgi:hypothetical protein